MKDKRGMNIRADPESGRHFRSTVGASLRSPFVPHGKNRSLFTKVTAKVAVK